MDVLQALAELKRVDWKDEDGGPVEVTFHVGVSETDVRRYETESGASLPLDYRCLLLNCRGIDGLTIELDFAAWDRHSWTNEIVPGGISFGHDGFGNYWVVDCLSTSEEEGTLFYHCHDAPVFLHQGCGMANFLLDLVNLEHNGENSTINSVHEDRLFEVWRTNQGVIPQTEAVTSPDPVIQAFAQELDGAFSVIDLRSVPTGMGFSWGRYGMNTRLRRFGEERFSPTRVRRRDRDFRKIALKYIIDKSL